MASILCIEHPFTDDGAIERALRQLAHEPRRVTSVDEAVQVLGHDSIELVIADYPMADSGGRDVLDVLRARGVEAPIIVMTDYATVREPVHAIRRGAIDYLTKPLRQEAVRLAVNNAIEIGRLKRENDDIRRQMIWLHGIVGEGNGPPSAPTDGGANARTLVGPALETLNLKELERIMILRALQTTGGHRARAARLLGISERTLRSKLNSPHPRNV